MKALRKEPVAILTLSAPRAPSFCAQGRAHLLATIMATRQRLRAVLDVRRASQPCWRCALNLSRYSSTSAAGTEESSESINGLPTEGLLRERMAYGKIRSTYDEVMEQDSDDKSTQLSSAEVAARRSDESKDSSSQTVHEHSFDAEGMSFFRRVRFTSALVRSVAFESPPGFDSPFPSLRKTGVQSN